MKEFLFVFRADYKAIAKASPEEMQTRMKKWMDWVAGISAQDKLVQGNHLAPGGRVVSYNGIVTDGPYTEIKESILGYIIVRGTSYDDALIMARACPILAGEGNTVEVRELSTL